jgi:hypothetical protein
MIKILYIIMIICIIISIYYTYTKLLYINQFENFSNKEKDIDNNDFDDMLIQYSYSYKKIKSVQDLHDLQKKIEEISKYFYLDIIDLYTNNNNEIIDNINKYLNLFKIKTGKQKIKSPIFVLLYQNYELKDIDDNISIGKPMSYVKLILIYTNYIYCNNNIIEKNNTPIFYRHFTKKSNYNIYKINKDCNLFNHHLQ